MPRHQKDCYESPVWDTITFLVVGLTAVITIFASGRLGVKEFYAFVLWV